MQTLTATATILIATSVLATEPQIHRDISYTDPADESRRLDVYAPADGKCHPVVIWLHGGGWRRGDKAAIQQKPQAFVDRGFLFVSANYRLVPQVTVKEMTGDIARAIKWVHGHANEYGGSPDTIFVAGHSAGAHLSALVCTDGSYVEAEGMALSAIKGCIPVDTAVYGIPRQLEGVGPLRVGMYTTAFGEDESLQKQVSPITHVARDKGIPPFLILHVADRPDSTTQSQAFAKALVNAGIQATVVAGKGKHHRRVSVRVCVGKQITNEARVVGGLPPVDRHAGQTSGLTQHGVFVVRVGQVIVEAEPQ